MSRQLNLDMLVARVVLDLNLIRWFATHDRRQDILEIVVRFRGKPEDRPALDAIERFIAS